MTETHPLLRSFVAVPLPAAVQRDLAVAAAELAGALPQMKVKWSKKPENLHITLKFLGPVAADRLEAFSKALGAELARVPRFDLVLRGWGAFPSVADAKVLFAGVEDREEDREKDREEAGEGVAALAAVAEVVETVSERFGFPREQRRFTGHVTVGRSKEGVDARAALAPGVDRAFGAVTVDEVHVYESQLGQGDDAGSTYVLRSRAALGTN